MSPPFPALSWPRGRQSSGSPLSSSGPQTCSSVRRSLERLLVGSQRIGVVGLRNAEAWRQLAVEQAGALQFVEAGQIADHVEAEVDEESRASFHR